MFLAHHQKWKQKAMDANEYVTLMKGRLTASFDFANPPKELLLPLSLWAVHNRKSEKYFLSKSISLYSYKNDEYVGLHVCTASLTKETLESCKNQFKRLIDNLPVDEQHMSSIVTSALISAEPVSEAVIGELAKVKYHKDFCFTLRGWCDLAVIVVDLPNERVYSNPFGQKIAKNFAFKN